MCSSCSSAIIKYRTFSFTFTFYLYRFTERPSFYYHNVTYMSDLMNQTGLAFWVKQQLQFLIFQVIQVNRSDSFHTVAYCVLSDYSETSDNVRISTCFWLTLSLS